MRQLGLKFWHRRRNLNRRLICFLPLSPVFLSPSRSDQFCNATLHLGLGAEVHCMPCILRLEILLLFLTSPLLEMQVKCPPRISLDCRQSCFMSSGSKKKTNLQFNLGKMWTSSCMLYVGMGLGSLVGNTHDKTAQFDQRPGPTAGIFHPKEVHLRSS